MHKYQYKGTRVDEMAGNNKAYWKLEMHWVVWFEWGIGVLKKRQRWSVFMSTEYPELS